MANILSKINSKLVKLDKYQPSPQELIEVCYENLKKCLNNGWTFEKLAKIISIDGFEISPSELKLHYNKYNKIIISKSNELTKKSLN